MESPPGWVGQDGEVLAEALDGDFAFLLVRDRTGGMHTVFARLVGDAWGFHGAGLGVGMLWTDDRTGRGLGVVGVGGRSSSQSATIQFQGDQIVVPVVDGFFAWMRPDVPPHVYPETVRA